MGATTLTEEEVQRYAKNREDSLLSDWALGLMAVRSTAKFPRTLNADGVEKLLRSIPQNIREKAEDRIRIMNSGRSRTGDDSPAVYEAASEFSGRYSTAMAVLERDGKLPSAGDVIGAISKYAFEKYSIDSLREKFDDAKEWSSRLIEVIKGNAFNTDDAVQQLWQRTGVIGFDIPIVGTLTLSDIRAFDWSASLRVPNLIDQIKKIDFEQVSSGILSTFAPEGGYADKGMQMLQKTGEIISSVSNLASTFGATALQVGLEGIGQILASAAPWIAVALALIALGEFVYGWYTEDAEAAKEAGEATKAIIKLVCDAVGASSGTSANEGTVALRIYEMAAYATPIRTKLNKPNCTNGAYGNIDPKRLAGSNGCWASGDQSERPGAVTLFGRSVPSEWRNRRKMAEYTRDFANSVLSQLTQYNTGNFTVDASDRRIAFEFLCTSLIPNATQYSKGLWPPENPLPGSAFKKSVISAQESQTLLRKKIESQKAWLSSPTCRTALLLFKATPSLPASSERIDPNTAFTLVGKYYGEGANQAEADQAAIRLLNESAKTLPNNYGITLWAKKGSNRVTLYEVGGTAYGGSPYEQVRTGGTPAQPVLVSGDYSNAPGNQQVNVIQYPDFRTQGGSGPQRWGPALVSAAFFQSAGDTRVVRVLCPLAQAAVDFVNKRTVEGTNAPCSKYRPLANKPRVPLNTGLRTDLTTKVLNPQSGGGGGVMLAAAALAGLYLATKK